MSKNSDCVNGPNFALLSSIFLSFHLNYLKNVVKSNYFQKENPIVELKMIHKTMYCILCLLTQTAFIRLCASDDVTPTSFADGSDDQKKSFHSLSSKIYGTTRVSNRTQFKAVTRKIKYPKQMQCYNIHTDVKIYVKSSLFTGLLFGLCTTTIINRSDQSFCCFIT